MSLSIDINRCTGCGLCVDVCPGQVLAIDEMGTPYEKYPEDCWSCGTCQMECPVDCIEAVFPSLIR